MSSSPSPSLGFDPSDVYEAAVRHDNPIAYWRLDDAGSTFIDRIAGSDGTGSGPIAVQQAGALVDGNKAVVFAQTTPEVIAVPTSAALSVLNTARKTTQELWVKLPDAPDATTIYKPLRYNDSFGVPSDAVDCRLTYIDADDAAPASPYWIAEFETPGNDVFASFPGAAGRWYHAVSVLDRDALTFTLYVNGVVAATSDALDLPPTMGHGLNIGGPFDHDPSHSPYEAWIGGVDEFALYASALTPVQVLAHYELGTTLAEMDAAYIVAIPADDVVVLISADDYTVQIPPG